MGCGAGPVAFAVVERYPDATVVGSDAAEPVLAENRERARADGHGSPTTTASPGPTSGGSPGEYLDGDSPFDPDR